MPFQKEAAYIGRTEFNEAWARMTRKIHTNMLARPFQRPLPKHVVPRPHPTVVPRSALRFKITKRLEMLSKQMAERLFTPKFTPPIPPEHFVEAAALLYVSTPRLEKLALPVIKIEPKKKRRRSARRLKLLKLFREHREEWLQLRAAPRKIPEPAEISIPRKRKKPINYETLYEDLINLARPRPQFGESPVRDDLQVSKAALKYKPSDRIKVMAQPKVLPEEAILDLTFKPFSIKKSALVYNITARMKELAKPLIRSQAVETDVKEDPFSVLPRALTAVCSKRTAKLAKPIQRE